LRRRKEKANEEESRKSVMKEFKDREEVIEAQRKGIPLQEIYLGLFFSNLLLSQESSVYQKELFVVKKRISRDREKHLEGSLSASEEKEVEVSFIFSKLCLSQWNTLTEEVIEKLNSYSFSFLILDHLKDLNQETALALSLFRGEYLSLNSLQSLEKLGNEISQLGKSHSFSYRHSQRNFKLVLNGVKEIDEEIAVTLAHESRIKNLYLGRIRNLEESTLSILCKSERIKKLCLNGMESLNEEQALILSRFKGLGIELDGLKALGAKVAQKLFQFQEVFAFISLNGLNHLEKGVAEAVNQWTPKLTQPRCTLSEISLSGLNVLKVKEIEALLKWRGLRLCLNGVKELKPEIWQFLSQLPLRELQLKALERLELETTPSSILSQMKSKKLHLEGLKDLKPEVVRELKKSNTSRLFLNGLRKLKPELAEAFGLFLKDRKEFSFPSLYLNGVEEIDKETAKIVSQWEGEHIYLGLKELKAEIAEVLSEWKGKDEYTYNNTLYLDKLEHLEPEIAQILFQPSGSESTSSSDARIELNGLRVFDEKLARILIQSKRRCSLEGIKYLKTEVKKMIGASENRISFSEEMKKQIEVYDLRKQEEERLKKEREEEQKKVWIRFASLTKEEQEKELVRMAEESSAQNNLEGEDE
jgi:hypothetical protein